MDMLTEINGKIYATAEAYIVTEPSQCPVEVASEIDKKALNPGFLWVAGRYVQANQLNRNGQYWTFDDLQRGEASIRYTPVNALHESQPIGVIVETKMIQREDASTKRILPEVQALAAIWEIQFRAEAAQIRDAHEKKQLWWSMECIAEARQCMTCERIFPWETASHLQCEHLAGSPKAPRRFINPVFLGGAMIYPPIRPGWADANITELADELVTEYAGRESAEVANWLRAMAPLMA